MKLRRTQRARDQFGSIVPLIRKPTILLHPLFLFSAVWLGVILLYSLHLSKLLLYSTAAVGRAVLYIWSPFALIIIGYTLLSKLLTPHPNFARKLPSIDLALLERQLTIAFRVWMIVSAVEIIISGGIPIVWLAQHSSKTYADFGIPSLHGLVNSLLLSISLCRFALFLLTSQRRHLRVPAFVLLWSILVITRNMLLVALIQFGILFLRLRPFRKATILKLTAGAVAFVLAFGVIGNYRSGSSDLIRVWAQPTENYPAWLPSGVLWAYIYAATPINNLVYNIDVSNPLYSALFPNTAATLFPSVLRNMIYGQQLGDAESGQLVSATFNVSTAYVGPYQDFGFAGIILFSGLTAFICQILWYRRGLKDVLAYVVLAQCLVLSLFWNQFFSLPIITQLVWLQIFLGRSSRPKRRFYLHQKVVAASNSG